MFLSTQPKRPPAASHQRAKVATSVVRGHIYLYMYVVCSVYKGKKEKVAKATTLQEQDPCGLRKSLCIYPIYFPYRHGNSLKLLYALYDGSGFSFYILHIKSHFIKCNMILT